MEHVDGQLQTSWCGGFFPWTLTIRFVCLSITPSCCLVCSFDTIYHPTDFTVMNETQKLMYHFRFYAVFVIWTKNEKQSKNTTDVKQRFFFPSCIFLRCCKRLYFSISLTVMQNLGRASVPSEHKANSGYSFYVFIKGFQRWNYILLFSVWIVLLFLSILHFKNKTLILL